MEDDGLIRGVLDETGHIVGRFRNGDPYAVITPELRVIEPRRSDWLQHLQADRRGGSTWCYFIGADKGPIKIGHSRDPVERLRHFQTGYWLPLRIFATVPGGTLREKAYHHQFREYRLEGEWFVRSRPIMAEIQRINS